MSPRLELGFDVGGTFTDCCLAVDGRTFAGKSPTTHGHLVDGIAGALRAAADSAGITVETALAEAERLVHGTTIATNAVVERRGAKTGLITTRGHGDSLLIMRGAGRTAGLPPEAMLRASRTRKPEPIVPRTLIREVDERIDWKGSVIVELDEEGARQALVELGEAGCEAVAVSLLWSFRNPDHERRLAELAAEVLPGVHVSIGSAAAPLWGEYERTVAAVFNAYTGPIVAGYLDELAREAEIEGSSQRLLIAQAAGGAASPARVRSRPTRLFQSGPAAGIVACQRLASELGIGNVITADVGGTTFDVGLIVDGDPIARPTMTVGQYDFHNRAVDVRSIGAGGGSVIRTDARSGAIRVGPQSAGADPGPACYGRGGEEPTLTDAMLALGFIAGAGTGGGMELDPEAALAALGRVAEPLEMEAIQLARAALAIAEHQMAELLHQVTIGRGYDPREFSLLAYGGGGPLHAAALARELAINDVLVPVGDLAAVWSAYGACVAPVAEVEEIADIESEPIDPDWLTGRYEAVRDRAVDVLVAEGIEREAIETAVSVDVRYRTQIHVVEVPVEPGVDPASLLADFDRRYEELYGKGSAYRDAGRQVVNFRCRAAAAAAGATFAVEPGNAGRRPTTRPIHWPDAAGPVQTPVYPPLARGQVVRGPALVELGGTTLTVQPGQFASAEESGVYRIASEDGVER